MASWVAGELGADATVVERAAALAKCDLVTGMVGEFPDLQGTMGRYYAISDGEPEAVADAIAEQYQPRFAGDALPDSQAGQILAIADKLDTLAGVAPGEEASAEINLSDLDNSRSASRRSSCARGCCWPARRPVPCRFPPRHSCQTRGLR